MSHSIVSNSILQEKNEKRRKQWSLIALTSSVGLLSKSPAATQDQLDDAKKLWEEIEVDWKELFTSDSHCEPSLKLLQPLKIYGNYMSQKIIKKPWEDLPFSPKIPESYSPLFDETEMQKKSQYNPNSQECPVTIAQGLIYQAAYCSNRNFNRYYHLYQKHFAFRESSTTIKEDFEDRMQFNSVLKSYLAEKGMG